jgi:hypothetical protein
MPSIVLSSHNSRYLRANLLRSFTLEMISLPLDLQNETLDFVRTASIGDTFSLLTLTLVTDHRFTYARITMSSLQSPIGACNSPFVYADNHKRVGI